MKSILREDELAQKTSRSVECKISGPGIAYSPGFLLHGLHGSLDEQTFAALGF